MRTHLIADHRHLQLENSRAEINAAHIKVGGGGVGLLFAIGSVCTFLLGLPALRWLMLGALVVGAFFSACMQFAHTRKTL